MSGIDDEVAEVQAVIDGLRARLEAALAEVGKARIGPTGPGHHKARRWARGEERRYTLRWLRAHGNLNACEAADSIEAGEHRPEGRHGVPTATEWDTLRARAEAAEQRAEAAEREVARLQSYRAEAEAAVHFAQAVAHLLASPDAEVEAVQLLRADDLPHLLECVRGRLILAATEPRWVRLRTEARPAGEVSDG